MGNISPSDWLNAARILAIVGSFLALLGSIGVSHFSKIVALNTNKEIQEGKTEAEKAKAVAAKANENAASANSNAASANADAAKAKADAAKANENAALANADIANAKVEAEELKLEVAKAKSEAEKAKLEREKLKDQMNFIKSISVGVSFTIPCTKRTTGSTNPLIKYPNGQAEKMTSFVLADNNGNPTFFMLDSWSYQQPIDTIKIFGLNYSKPLNQNVIYGRRLNYFKDILDSKILISPFLNKHSEAFDTSKLIKYNVIITVNGRKVIDFHGKEIYPGEIREGESFTFDLNKEFQKIPNILLNES